MHSTGRGGAGNITRLPEESVLEDERAFSPPRDGQIHSTGRGGLANITALNEPHVESPPGTEGSGTGTQFFSTGRGGAGNIGRSSSRGPGRSSSRGPENKHGQSAIGRFVDHITGHAHEHNGPPYEGERGRPNEKAF